MRRSLAFVLAGGGARGALQVGALRALLESGIRPDLLVGTSIGAINAAFLGLHGYTTESLDLLKAAWFAVMGWSWSVKISFKGSRWCALDRIYQYLKRVINRS